VSALFASAALFAVFALRTEIPLEPTAHPAVDQTLIAVGAQLAAIGNCNICHTREDGLPFAGGRPIVTPFGRVFSTNITPDPHTGIGGWSEVAFVRAMREGVSRDGRHLYPAFPYDHMTKMRELDIRAVYAFIMTRKPVRALTPPNALAFPFNIRLLVAGWKLLFLDRTVLETDQRQTAEWNEGAYLVEGLGHCGACHTPRNLLGAEKKNQAYTGGESDGWTAPALNGASPAAVPWDVERLFVYLRHGRENFHGAVAGPMAPVVSNLAS
jgi:mono/diheme cytochrome c family protein